jgi:hypothetical protein
VATWEEIQSFNIHRVGGDFSQNANRKKKEKTFPEAEPYNIAFKPLIIIIPWRPRKPNSLPNNQTNSAQTL